MENTKYTSNKYFVEQDEFIEKRKKQHLENVRRFKPSHNNRCLHNECPECFGTGIKLNGFACVHMLSCGYSKCSPY